MAEFVAFSMAKAMKAVKAKRAAPVMKRGGGRGIDTKCSVCNKKIKDGYRAPKGSMCLAPCYRGIRKGENVAKSLGKKVSHKLKQIKTNKNT